MIYEVKKREVKREVRGKSYTKRFESSTLRQAFSGNLIDGEYHD